MPAVKGRRSPKVFEAQESLPVSVPGERAINEQCAMRLIAFIRSELEVIPAWHPQHHEYWWQLRRLEGRLQLGPRSLP